jgi:signal transduction histidine kinase
MVAIILWDDAFVWRWITWLSGHIPVAIARGALMVWYERTRNEQPEISRDARYVTLYFSATLFSGLAYGAGWLLLAPVLSTTGQFVYLLAIIALLFGGLHTYSPAFGTYIAYSAASLWWLPFSIYVFPNHFLPSHIEEIVPFIPLIALVSSMFAIRFCDYFAINHQLQKNIETLLSEVTQRHAQAVETNTAKTRFLASVSHDLRQPMHAVSLSVATVENAIANSVLQGNDKSFVETQLRRLRGLVEHLNGLFENLLDLSRIESGALRLNLRPIDLSVFLREVVDRHQTIADAQGLHLDLKFRNVPADGKLEAIADRLALERVMNNLLVNAFRYTEAGGVRISVYRTARHFEVRLVDTGLGIPLALRERIFEDFIQVREHQAQTKKIGIGGVGFGLGLSIARRLVMRMQGTLRCHSWQSVGSVFRLTLPAQDAAREKSNKPIRNHPPEKYSSDPSLQPRFNLRGLFIVVVDDEIEILESTQLLLSSLGAEVICASNSNEAKDRLAKINRCPDLLLVDYRLHDESGISVIENLREEYNAQIPAIIITGETSSEVLTNIDKRGLSTAYKPLNARSLLRQIQEASQSESN